MKNKLNLGCGKDILKDYINLDHIKYKGVDVVHDINMTPWPIKKNSIVEIKAYSILEHIDNPVAILNEMYRVSKKNCKISIIVPYFNSYFTWVDITHKRGFTPQSFTEFIDIKGKNSELILPAKFKVTKVELLPSASGKFIPKFIRNFLSRYISNLIDNVYVEMKVIK